MWSGEVGGGWDCLWVVCSGFCLFGRCGLVVVNELLGFGRFGCGCLVS